MALVWAVPVVAAAVAVSLVAIAARPVGDAVTGLADDLRALRRVRTSLAAVREVTADSEVVGAEFRLRHPSGGSADQGGGSPLGDQA